MIERMPGESAEETRGRMGEGRRVEYAPTACGAGPSSGVISVVLNEDEEVLWCWTHFPDGSSAVTGYEILKADRGAEEAGFSFEHALVELLWPEGKQSGVSSPTETFNNISNRARRQIGFLPLTS